jgi:heme/copper-type cytochrome/quinol oxidase subunit 3
MPTKRSSTKPISRINLADQLSSHRAIDLNVRKTQADLSNRFAYVTKARANVWVVVAVVLFIFGLLFSIFYVTKDSTYEDAYNFGGAAFFGDTKLIDPIPEPPLVTGPSHLVVGQDASFTFQVAATTTNATIIEGQWGDGTT